MGALRFLILMTALLAAVPAAAKKHALLIGNGAYTHSNKLSGPKSDVEAMSKALKSLGYQVTVKRDLNHADLGDALLDFGVKARSADTALVYFSGHGMEIGGENYLIPTNARLRRPGSERVEAIPLSLAIDATNGAKRLSVVIVDACRNGAPGAQRSGVSKGFRAIRARPGLAIAFSTAPGEPAWDGNGSMSPYTRALTEAIGANADIDVRLLLTSLGEDTARYAGAEQRPFSRFGHMPRNKSLSLSGRSTVAGFSRPVTPRTPPVNLSGEDDLIDIGPEALEAQRKGNPSKLNALGYDYERGINGKRKDLRASARLYRASCALGYARGCANLGVMYRDGKGLKKDPHKAFSLFRQGCERGNMNGCALLGHAYEKGTGVTQSYKSAVKYYGKGCEGLSAISCNNLGVHYHNGWGVTKDKNKAAEYYRKALKIDADYKSPIKNLDKLGMKP